VRVLTISQTPEQSQFGPVELSGRHNRADRASRRSAPHGKGAAMAKAKSGGGRARSAITGRYVKRSTATRHPKTTVVESTRKSGK